MSAATTERPRADTNAPEPAPTFTADELLNVIRRACIRRDPQNAETFMLMDASHIREASRINSYLLDLHEEYQRTHRITQRGRRAHARAIYRVLDVVPRPYLIVAEVWSLLPAAILGAPEPDPTVRSPLRTDHGPGADGEATS
jgi:hypothetical protein